MNWQQGGRNFVTERHQSSLEQPRAAQSSLEGLRAADTFGHNRTEWTLPGRPHPNPRASGYEPESGIAAENSFDGGPERAAQARDSPPCGDRTHKLASGTTSEPGRYVKSLGEPRRGRCLRICKIEIGLPINRRLRLPKQKLSGSSES